MQILAIFAEMAVCAGIRKVFLIYDSCSFVTTPLTYRRFMAADADKNSKDRSYKNTAEAFVKNTAMMQSIKKEPA
jgi:hypothetical protein